MSTISTFQLTCRSSAITTILITERRLPTSPEHDSLSSQMIHRMNFFFELNSNTAHTTTIAPNVYATVQVYPNTRYDSTPLTIILAPFIINLTMLSKYFTINPMVNPSATTVATII